MEGAGWGILFAILSMSSQIGKGLQKDAVKSLPELTCAKKDVVVAYLTNKRWMLGLVVDLFGAVMGLLSLGTLPISIAQPIFCSGLALLAVFSFFYLGERLGAVEWVGVAVCVGGVTGLALTLEETDWTQVDFSALQLRLGIALLLVPVVLVVSRRPPRGRREPTNVVASRCSRGRRRGSASAPATRAWARGCTSLGLGGATEGRPVLADASSSPASSRRRRTPSSSTAASRTAASSSSAYATLVSMLMGVLMGVAVLGEPWPSDPARSMMRIFGIVAIGIPSLLNAPELRKLGASKRSPTPTADNVLTTLDTTDGQWGLNDAARAAEAERQEAAAGLIRSRSAVRPRLPALECDVVAADSCLYSDRLNVNGD